MARCPHCDEYLVGYQQFCPACEQPTDESDTASAGIETRGHIETQENDRDDVPLDLPGDDESLAVVARFMNAAEAGYFAHELTETKELPVSLSIDEHFDALSGSWRTRYVLSVPESRAAEAAYALGQMVEQTEFDGADSEANWPVGEPTVSESRPDVDPRTDETPVPLEEDSNLHWVPIVLTLTAGSVAFWGARRLQEQPKAEIPRAPIGQQQDALWDRLGESQQPWVQQLEHGRGWRELRIDALHGTAILREDVDGDGTFEKQIPLRRAALN